jgi:uncharacterized membrane protein
VERIPAIDNLRGLVMVLMTLDHVRDFFTNVDYSPTDLSKTSAVLFLTRWITHYCAPTFIFLAGTSAYLSGRRASQSQLSRFLLTRGLWIAFLSISFESLVWCFWPEPITISGAVLWAIGWSMVCLAGLVCLPLPVIVTFGLVMIAGHNVFDGLTQQDFGHFGPLWAVLHSGDTFQIGNQLAFEPHYPLIPWIGVMAVGYSFGALMLLDESRRNRRLYLIGILSIALFIGLRYSNAYGDPRPWASQSSPVFTLFSFLNCHKYPPSLCYLLMTLGPAIALLPVMNRINGRICGLLQVFGQTPMFFYLLHLPLIIALSLANTAIVGFDSGQDWIPKGFPEAYGYTLPVVYAVWVLVLAILYPFCRRFRELKRNRSYAFLRYL